MKDKFCTIIFLLIFIGIGYVYVAFGELYGIIAVVLGILLLTGWIHISTNISVNIWSKERDEYEKFLEDNDFDEYDEDLSKKEIYAKELELCTEFLEENPKNYYAIEQKAELCFKLGKYKDSMKAYKIIKDKNGYESNFINYAKCHYVLGDKEKALKIIDSYYSGEDFAGRCNGHATLYRDLKEYDKSIEEYTSAIEFRSYSFYYNYRAEVYQILKQYDRALEDFTEAIELDKKYSHFYADRAGVYKILKQYDKAIEDYTKAIELENKSDFGYFYYKGRAKVYAIIKNYDKAIADLKRYNEGLDISDDDDNYYQNEIERYQYEWFLECNNFDILADDSENEENTLKELELCDKFLREAPDNRYAIKQKAELFFRLEKYEDALNIYKALSKKDSEYTVSTAMCYYASGEKEKALKIIKDYYQGRNEDDVYYADVAKMNKIAKEYKEAIKNYTSAINCKPDYSYYYKYRAKVYKILNEQDKYKADMKKYKELEKEYNSSEDVDDSKNDNSSKEGLNKSLKP